MDWRDEEDDWEGIDWGGFVGIRWNEIDLKEEKDEQIKGFKEEDGKRLKLGNLVEMARIDRGIEMDDIVNEQESKRE